MAYKPWARTSFYGGLRRVGAHIVAPVRLLYIPLIRKRLGSTSIGVGVGADVGARGEIKNYRELSRMAGGRLSLRQSTNPSPLSQHTSSINRAEKGSCAQTSGANYVRICCVHASNHSTSLLLSAHTHFSINDRKIARITLNQCQSR